ncbi:hypothetical protein Tco_0088982 [Tanacetum coccineum]
MEYLVNISKRRAFWSLNEDILKIYYSDYQYAVSIKEDTAYPCLHSPKTTKERRSIRRIQKKSIRRIKDIVCEYSGRYQTWSLLQETPIRRIQSLGYAEEFLVELRKNMYHRTYKEDMVDHIAKVLKMVDLIYVPGMDSHQIRMKVFPLSLADDAKEWWISEGDGKITTWEELVETFFYRFYPESYDGEDEMLDEVDNWGIDPI